MPGASAPGLFLEIEMPTKKSEASRKKLGSGPNKHLKSNRGGLLGKAKRALGGRRQQLDAMEARAMGKKKK